MTPHTTSPPVLLIPGHWLGAWAWDDVLAHLGDDLHAEAMTLPGLDPADPRRATRTLDDQVAAIEERLLRAGAPAIVVAHSGANGPVTVVLDRHPELVRHMVWVDSGPVAPGSVFAADLPAEVRELPLPPLDVLAQQASLDGLDATARERFRARAVPEPGPVLRAPVELTNDARAAVPTTLVCCSIPGDVVRELAREGHPMFAEVAALSALEVIDLPTGHWPMWSRPSELAGVIRSIALRAA